jgi:Raf kinase inhibitor-like YbhB/YbcL family protein
MGRRTRSRTSVLVLLVLGLLWGACSSEPAGPTVLAPGERMPDGMTLTSPAFEDARPIPERYSCEGENLPPPLRWTGTPAGATELALVIEDPDATGGVFVHWIVAGIDPGATSIEPGPPPAGADEFKGSSDMAAYIGPCPPDDGGVHRYHFQIYALRARPRLVESSPPVEKVRAIRKAAVAGGQLIGTFER